MTNISRRSSVRVHIAVLATLQVGLCAAAHAQQCVDNFSKEGGFFRGATYQTHVNVVGAEATPVFEAIYRNMLAEGWQVTQSDATIGVISASAQNLPGFSLGSNHPVAVNALVQPGDDGVRVSLTLSYPGGAAAPQDGIRERFCRLFNGVGAQTGGSG